MSEEVKTKGRLISIMGLNIFSSRIQDSFLQVFKCILSSVENLTMFTGSLFQYEHQFFKLV